MTTYILSRSSIMPKLGIAGLPCGSVLVDMGKQQMKHASLMFKNKNPNLFNLLPTKSIAGKLQFKRTGYTRNIKAYDAQHPLIFSSNLAPLIYSGELHGFVFNEKQ